MFENIQSPAGCKRNPEYFGELWHISQVWSRSLGDLVDFNWNVHVVEHPCYDGEGANLENILKNFLHYNKLQSIAIDWTVQFKTTSLNDLTIYT